MRKFRQLRRTGRRPLEPLSAQVAYLKALKGVLSYARALVHARLMPRLDRWIGERADSHTPQHKQVLTVVSQIRTALESKFSDAKIEKIAEGVADEVSAHERRQLAAQVGIELPARSERGLGRLTDAFTHENVALIKTVSAQYLDGVQSAVMAGLSSGMRHEALAKVLEAKHGVASSRAALIARDQVNKFNGRLAQARQQNLGIVSYVWNTVKDQRVRDSHEERDGQTYDWSDPPGDLSDPADGGHPGAAINCFPAETRISTPSLVLKAYRRRYAGNLTELVTEDLKTVRCTPNHPILTLRGWVPAHLVDVGEYVLKAAPESFDVGVEDLQNADASAVEVFSTAQLLFASRLGNTGAAGFHGDVSDQEVDIVDINRCLSVERYTSSFQKLCEHLLALTYDSTARLGPAAQLFGTASLTSDSRVRGGCQLLSLLGGECGVSDEHGRATAARVKTCLDKAAPNHTTADVEMLGHLLDAAPLSVQGLQRLARQIYAVVCTVITQAPGLQAPSAESLAQAVGVYSEQPTNLNEALAGQQCSRVIKKGVSEFSGHVYNLETASNWFSAEGITSHNCRCFAEPLIPGLEDPTEDPDIEPDADIGAGP